MGSLIYSESEVKKFIEIFYDFELKDNEVIFLSLIARKKYFDKLRANQSMMDRKIIKDKTLFLQKLKNIAVVNGRFFINKDTEEIELPETAFGIYVDLKPKCVIKATSKIMNELGEAFYLAISNNDFSRIKNIQNRYFSAIQVSNSNNDTNNLFLIDIDVHDEKLLEKIIDIINKENIKGVIDTGNGFHIYVKKNKRTGELLFRHNILTKKEFENIVEIKSKNFLTPVPGTLKNGKKVKIKTI